ncbi:hypothetical protein AVEN_161017-1 [Araneus ventricosus]|uniref:CCHC-type domain-containing protein n=2 Tax=Araneus ventricosus TaxID=182803 RepID=A0A4Y2HK86_ARAVE|nr:hypothetical protein AVEN_144137-1 [Araneus ventricosus]GBM65762.1 hypothetical protein AVEN_152101-1 [Araneus ventricosus]GBO23725.1 hypothetical protein AVEN_272033-1 [Araneus ventricosus]GBO23733.1 hypothetical protein AVEN_161017-1 [Araneus ventricosus]
MTVEDSDKKSDGTPTILTYQFPRNPCVFSGDEKQDASRWLKDFERIASYNHWDDQMKLANVVFYLADTARLWFDNNEDDFTNWAAFQESLEKTFCRIEENRRQAERLLQTRAQLPGESSESYIQDVLSLCTRVNQSMPENEKIAHLMKGINEELYQILLVQDYSTTKDLVERCRQIENLRRRRITKEKFQRLPNISAASSRLEEDDLKSLVRTLVREEIQRFLPKVQDLQYGLESTADVASIVRDEVMQALSPLSTPQRRNTAPIRRSAPAGLQQRRIQRSNAALPRKTDVWRTNDNVPLCFHCGRPGHVFRYCRERRQVFASAKANRTPYSRRDSDFDMESIQSYGADDNYSHPTPTRQRSSSPYPRRSSNRRQSQSPVRRSSRSPRRFNEEN